jgi:two-component system, NtrC family, response regulator GlrR
MFGRPSSLTITAVTRDRLELPSAVVEVTSPGGLALRLPLGLEPIVVGSDPNADVVLADPQVSRRHCALELSEDGLVLRDLGSKNGTWIAGLRVLGAFVEPGTPITVGASHLSVRLVGPPARVDLSPRASFGEALGGTSRMRALFSRLEIAARTEETILLFGETGTGKELLARAIHQASERREGPFVVFDCGAVAPNLVEAELFGHVKGAFTGASSHREGLFADAAGGVLFLDEIGELPLDVQPKLLRALEARQVRPLGSNTWRPLDVRVVAATHRDLRRLSHDGGFREDLYFRLAVIEARIPPLRERRDDIELITERLLASQRPPRSLAELPTGTLEMLRAHDWPGNVRELRNVVARLALFPDLGRAALEEAAPPQDAAPAARDPIGDLLHLSLREARETVVDAFEVRYLSAVLAAHDGNVSRAAAVIGISRQMLHKLIERHGIRPQRG